MIAYQVNGHYINNLYLALHECWKTGGTLGLYCYDQEFNQFDWTVEPTASIDFLMSEHARVLRNRYERLVLLWSGGTDSHTIYNVFKNNRIHLDEILSNLYDSIGILISSKDSWPFQEQVSDNKSQSAPLKEVNNHKHFDSDGDTIPVEDEDDDNDSYVCI